MGDEQQPRGRDGRFLPAAGSTLRVRDTGGKVHTYRAGDAGAAQVAGQVKATARRTDGEGGRTR